MAFPLRRAGGVSPLKIPDTSTARVRRRLCGATRASLSVLVLLGGFSSLAAEDKPASKGEPAKTEKPAAEVVTGKLSQKTLQARLLVRTDLEADKLPLNELVKRLSEQHDVPIRLDLAGLKKAGVAPDAPITVSVRNFTLNATLRKILKDYALHHVIDGGAIVITDVNTNPGAPAEEPAAQPAARAAPARRGAVRQEAVVPAAVAIAEEQQYLAQIRPMARAEFAFVRRVCEPTPEQRRLLAAEAASSLKVVARQFAESQQKMQRGGWRSGDTIPQPQQQIQAGFAVAVEALLSPEQAARYADETAKREANRRRVAVQSVVARLDQNLRLSAEQRERLCASLPEHWKDSWSQQLWIGNENLPPIPEKAVATILNPAQLKIWKSIPKSGDVMFFGVRFGFMGMQGEEVGADDEDDLGRALKELAEKKPDEPKPAEKTE